MVREIEGRDVFYVEKGFGGGAVSTILIVRYNHGKYYFILIRCNLVSVTRKRFIFYMRGRGRSMSRKASHKVGESPKQADLYPFKNWSRKSRRGHGRHPASLFSLLISLRHNQSMVEGITYLCMQTITLVVFNIGVHFKKYKPTVAFYVLSSLCDT